MDVSNLMNDMKNVFVLISVFDCIKDVDFELILIAILMTFSFKYLYRLNLHPYNIGLIIVILIFNSSNIILIYCHFNS